MELEHLFSPSSAEGFFASASWAAASLSTLPLVALPESRFNPVAIASRHRRPRHSGRPAARYSKVFDTYEQLLDDSTIEVLDIALCRRTRKLALIKSRVARKTAKGFSSQSRLV